MLVPIQRNLSKTRLSSHKSIFWHDYETWGAQPRKDRPCQFAGIRTDEDLNIIDDPVSFYCKPTPDYLPHPEACLVTGICPETALEKGLAEVEFSARIAEQFMQPNTCVSGYNSIRFDDEVTRHMLYRNFYDPYEREWKNGNSRWDIIDLVRMTHALRPEGIQWPQKDDGRPSFRLQDLTSANSIEHEGAHDALADVVATIEMAKCIKQAQPKLYDWLYQLRSKNKVKPLLDLRNRDMLLHASGMFSSTRGCLAIVMPLLMHPVNQNGVIVVDLNQDPDSWLDLDAEEIRRRVFSRNDDLEEGVERVALKTIHINKCPALAPMSVLDEETVSRYAIDLEGCAANREKLLANNAAMGKLRLVFADQHMESLPDPDHMLYSGGFFNDQDRSSMENIKRMPAENLADLDLPFQDKRLPEMLFRYRARNFPESLNSEESLRWQAWCAEQIKTNPNGVGLTAVDYFARLEKLAIEKPEEKELLACLYSYADRLCQKMNIVP
jgi:exodeoxyribonuclease I